PPFPALLGVVVPVEVADLVRAVVGAVARPDAPVVDLPVQPVVRVVGGIHRTHRLAGRVAALLAQHRRNHGADGMTSLTTRSTALDPEPAHLAAPAHGLLNHGGEGVLSVAGGGAGGAAG